MSRPPLRVGLALLVLVAILGFGLSPEPVPEWFAHQDKLQHLVGFAVLAAAVGCAFPRVHGASLVLGVVALAGLVELGQGPWLPGRVASVTDWLAGAAGAGIGGWMSRRRTNAP